MALLQTIHRFRTKRQLWAYCGFAVEFTTAVSTVGCEANYNATVSASRCAAE